MFFQKYLEYLPIFIAAVFFFAVALVLWLTGRRALAGSRGGLDWVKDYRTSGFDFSVLRRRKQDWLCLFAVAVFAMIFSAAVISLHSEYETGVWVRLLYRPKNLCKLALYAAGAVSVCWLLQDLFRDNTLALCGGILSALSFVGSRTATLVFAISLMLFVEWFILDEKKRLFPGALLLLGSDLMLGVAASRILGFAWVGVAFLAVHIYKTVHRMHAEQDRTWELFVMPVCGAVVFAIGFVAAKTGALYTSGAVALSDLPSKVTPAYVLRMLQRLLTLPRMIFTAPLQRQTLLHLLLDAPLLMAGIFGFFVACRTAHDRHDPSSLICAAVTLVLGLAWILTRQYILNIGFVLCTVCLLRRFTAAEKKAPVIVYTVLSCLYYLGLYLLIYMFSGPAAVVDIIA